MLDNTRILPGRESFDHLTQRRFQLLMNFVNNLYVLIRSPNKSFLRFTIPLLFRQLEGCSIDLDEVIALYEKLSSNSCLTDAVVPTVQ